MALKSLLIAYVIGGLTFIPFLLLSILAFIYLTSKRVQPADRTSVATSDRAKVALDTDSGKDDISIDEETGDASTGNDAAGYFAVCREYVPGGINGKPPERASPAGDVLISESPSVYQSMYRSIFERNKSQTPAVEGEKKDFKIIKRPRNIFFVVLRHKHLLLFDNADQLEVRHVVSLLHHDVDVYGGGDKMGEGDLWIKKNCIRLTRRTVAGQPGPVSQPFYIFSDNCSEKEDFYHALLHAQAKARDTDVPPSPKEFEMDHIIKLVQALHRSDADAHCRWINALIGRIFLALYKTQEIEDLVRAKIDRKISRVSKPNFITSIQVQNVQMGDAAPIFSNPKLKELMVDGSLTIETDVRYNGGFRLQIAAIARIELGSRIRAREVDLVLAGVLRKLSGHLLIRIKPPPSNRIWLTFETPPQMDFAVEPVVSSMQITYSVILRAIESRIKEVIGETLVLPNWDDVPFFDTDQYSCRGGIWDIPRRTSSDDPADDAASEIVHSDSKNSRSPKAGAIDSTGSDEEIDNFPPISSKAMSMPSLLLSPNKDTGSRKSKRKPVSISEEDGVSSAVSLGNSATPSPTKSKPSSPRMQPAEKPRAMRSNSFASAATPLVSTEDASVSLNSSPASKGKGQRDAVKLFKDVKARSDSMPVIKPSPDLTDSSAVEDDASLENSRRNSKESALREADMGAQSGDLNSGVSLPVLETGKKRGTWNFPGPPPPGSALERATTTAKNWGISMMNRQSGISRRSQSGFTSLAKEAGLEVSSASQDDIAVGDTAESDNIDNAKSSDKPLQPMGRGQPLPPAGTPLPGPKQSLWAGSPLNIGSLKRKPVAIGTKAANNGDRNSDGSGSDKPGEPQRRRSSTLDKPVTGGMAVPRSTNRRSSQRYSAASAPEYGDSENMIVVEAPPEEDSEVEAVPPRLPARPVSSKVSSDENLGRAPDASHNTEETSSLENATTTEHALEPNTEDIDTSLVGQNDDHEGEIIDSGIPEDDVETGTIDTGLEGAPPPSQHHLEAVQIRPAKTQQVGGWHTGAAIGAQLQTGEHIRETG